MQDSDFRRCFVASLFVVASLQFKGHCCLSTPASASVAATASMRVALVLAVASMLILAAVADEASAQKYEKKAHVSMLMLRAHIR